MNLIAVWNDENNQNTEALYLCLVINWNIILHMLGNIIMYCADI